MRQDKLAPCAAYDMLLPQITFLGRERAIVIGGENFGIGTKFFFKRSEDAPPRTLASGLGDCAEELQMAAERFFKVSIVRVRRHGLLLS